MLHKLLVLALLLAAGLLHGQSPAFRYFTSRDGLPQSQPQVLLEDRHGFLWVGTRGGVARLGGQGFQTFGGIRGLKGTRVAALAEAPDGAMWVGYEDGGLVRILGTRVAVFGADQGLTVPDTFALAVDAGGLLWVGTREGLFLGREGTFQRIALPQSWSRAPIFALAADPSGGLWLGSAAGRLAYWNGRSLQEVSQPQGPALGDLHALARDPAGRIWAQGTRGVVRRESDHQWVAVSLPGGGSVHPSGLAVASTGEVLLALGTDGLVSLFPDGRQEVLGPRQGISQAGLYCAYRDREGHLWLGTNGDGLAVEAVPGMVQFTAANGPELGGVLALHEHGPGDYFMGGTRGLFRWQEGRGWTGAWSTPQGLPSPVVRALLPDGRGGLWIATSKGLAHWREGRLHPVPAPLATLPMTHLLAAEASVFAATDQGLVRFDDQGHHATTFPIPAEAGQPQAYSLRQTRQGLLVGSMHGVFRFTGDALVRQWPDAPFSAQPVSDLREDARGILWVATTKGLYLGGDGGWRRIGMAEGLPDELVWVLGDGGQGRTVVGHGKGLSIFDGEHRLHLNQSLGLLSDETNQGGLLLDSRERLWVGMIGGITRLETRNLPQRDPLPPPQVEGVAWPGGSQPFPASLTLPPKPQTLDFYWDLGLPLVGRPPRYQARMLGLEPDWRTVEGGHALYGKLPPGTYAFQVRTSLDGVRWTEGTPIALRVPAAWSEALLTRVAAALLVVGLGWTAVTARIRRLKRAKQELERKVLERTAALAASEQKAREASQAKSTFLANMSHELRTPLNAVLGFAQVLDRDNHLRPDSRENLRRILRAGEHLLGLINDVLSISKIEAGRITLNPRAFDSHQLLSGIAEMAEVRAQAKGLQFTLAMAPGFPQHLEGDDGKLRQVLLNLVGNALKFTEAGSVALRADYRDGFAHFEVEDTGVGIPEAELSRLFEAFHQTEAGRRQLEGTGLGLHIGQAMVQLMGGEITVRSQPGQGSTFAFAVPLYETPLRSDPEAAQRVTGLEPGQGAPRILIVDDRAENRLVLTRLLGPMGFELREAEDGVEAVEATEAWHPDVVLMDIRMPRMDGFEALRRIRELARPADLPPPAVIALTASAFDHDHDAMLRAGFDDHVGKPFKEGDLFASLTRTRGLRFRREAPQPRPSAGAGRARPGCLSQAPADWLAAFRLALDTGDREDVIRLLEVLEDRALAGELQGMARAYRFEDLARLSQEPPRP